MDSIRASSCEVTDSEKKKKVCLCHCLEINHRYNLDSFSIMQGFSRLQKLGMCMSRKSTDRKMKETAQHYQKKFKSWKASIEMSRNTPTSESSISPQNQQQVQFLKCTWIFLIVIKINREYIFPKQGFAK